MTHIDRHCASRGRRPSQRASAARLETRRVTAEVSSSPGHRLCWRSATGWYLRCPTAFFSSLALPSPSPCQPGLPRPCRNTAPSATRVVYARAPDLLADTAASYHDSARVHGSGVVPPRHHSTPNQSGHVRAEVRAAAWSAGRRSASTGARLPTQPAEHCRARQPRPA